jgi:hypothetical protein
LALAVEAVWLIAHHEGPFAGASPDLSALRTQMFVGVLSITALLVAAVRSQGERAETAMAQAQSQERELRQLTLTDPLTGLSNVTSFHEVLATEIARAQRAGRPLRFLRRAPPTAELGGSCRRAGAAQEVLDRLGGDLLHELVGDHSAVDERGDPLDRGEQDDADTLRFTAFDAALCLALVNQLEHHAEGAVGRRLQRAVLLAMLAGEHQPEERRVRRRECDVGGGGGPQPCAELLPRPVDGRLQVMLEPREAGSGQRVEQRLAIREVTARRGMADTELARQLTQRQLLHAVLTDGELGLGEQGGAQASVVVGPFVVRHREAA